MKKEKTLKEKEFEDYTKEQQEIIKELVIAKIKQVPDDWRLCIG